MIKKQHGHSKLLLVDDLSPEDVAMLQALYSRSSESAEVHLRKLTAGNHPDPLTNAMEEAVLKQRGLKTKSSSFMERFYVNYGHKSIADCGSTTLFIEDVSLLAAKAIQDWPLYCGQETSTRYIDMGSRRIVDPVGSSASAAILERWMDFYRSNQSSVASHVRSTHPKGAHEKDDAYEGAVRARTFDIMRGFLPAGITTQLSWHTNLRQAGDHLSWLVQHPSEEIASIAMGLRSILAAQYPSSGMGMSLPGVSGTERSAETEAALIEWQGRFGADVAYNAPQLCDRFNDGLVEMQTSIRSLKSYTDILSSRPRGAVLPHFLSDLGQCTFLSLLDFGSFRDAQRHRNGVCRMPGLDTRRGFERWYVQQLPIDIAEEAYGLIAEQSRAIESLDCSPVDRQYYVALGYRVPCSFTYALPATVYTMELRSGKAIHPTYRRVIHGMVREFESVFPEVALHVDRDPDDWTVRRGSQTITARGSS
jgi:thymidylate synthase ThyX